MDEDLIRELFSSEGSVRIRRMFGGQGIYLDGMIVAVAVKGELLLKADDESAPLFEEAGGGRWLYARPGGKSPVAMPYFTLPSDAYDDADSMALWARRAKEAALRARKSGKPQKRRTKVAKARDAFSDEA